MNIKNNNFKKRGLKLIKWPKKTGTIMLGLIFSFLLFIPVIHADTWAYVCRVKYYPISGGSIMMAPRIEVWLTTEPDCTGTNLGNYNIHSADSCNNCYSTTYLPSELLALMPALHEQMMQKRTIYLNYILGSNGQKNINHFFMTAYD